MSATSKTKLNTKVDVLENEKSAALQVWEVTQIVLEVVFLWVKMLWAIIESVIMKFMPTTVKSVNEEIVLITGTGHGIGKELALQYGALGATVVGWDINAKNNEDTMEEIRKNGNKKCYSFVCDVSNREDVMAKARQVEEKVGHVTILVNNAGIMPTHPLLQQTEAEIDKTFKINVYAHFWTLQAFLPDMLKKNRGHIVAISSCAGIFGLQNLVPYCGTKFAVRGYMEALYNELLTNNSDLKINFTTIYPYMVDTGLCKKPRIRFEKAMPLLQPKDVAAAVIDAQRKNIFETTLPSYILNMNNCTRLLPMKSAIFLKNFLDSGVDSDL